MQFTDKFYAAFKAIDLPVNDSAIKELYQAEPVYFDCNLSGPDKFSNLVTLEQLLSISLLQFKNTATFKILQQQLTIILDEIHKICTLHNLSRANDWNFFKDKIVNRQMKGVNARTIVAMYSSGKRALEAIALFYSDTNKVNEQSLNAMQNFINDDRLVNCFSGASIGLVNFSIDQVAINWSNILHNMRRKYILQEAIYFIRDLNNNREEFVGNEIHEANSLCNSVRTEYHLQYIDDPLGKETLAEHKAHFQIKIQHKFAINIMSQLIDYLYNSAELVKNFSQANDFEKRFNMLGTDERFHLPDLFSASDDETVIFNNENAKLYICWSLITRMTSAGYINQDDLLVARQSNTTTQNYVATHLVYSWFERYCNSEMRFVRTQLFDSRHKNRISNYIDKSSLLKLALQQQYHDAIKILVAQLAEDGTNFGAILDPNGQSFLYYALYYNQIDFFESLFVQHFMLLDIDNKNLEKLLKLAGDTNNEVAAKIMCQAILNNKLILYGDFFDRQALFDNLSNIQNVKEISLIEIFAIIYAYKFAAASNYHLNDLLIKCINRNLALASEFLLDCNANPNCTYISQDGFIQTPLYNAVYNESYNCIMTLINYGADPLACSQENYPLVLESQNQHTICHAFHLAVYKNYVPAVKLFIYTRYVNDIHSFQELINLMNVAISMNYPETLNALLGNIHLFAEEICKHSGLIRMFGTILCQVAEKNWTQQAVKLCLLPIDLLAPDKKYKYAIEYAIENNNIEIVSALTSFGVDPGAILPKLVHNNSSVVYSTTPLNIAVMHCNHDIIKHLLMCVKTIDEKVLQIALIYYPDVIKIIFEEIIYMTSGLCGYSSYKEQRAALFHNIRHKYLALTQGYKDISEFEVRASLLCMQKLLSAAHNDLNVGNIVQALNKFDLVKMYVEFVSQITSTPLDFSINMVEFERIFYFLTNELCNYNDRKKKLSSILAKKIVNGLIDSISSNPLLPKDFYEIIGFTAHRLQADWHKFDRRCFVEISKCMVHNLSAIIKVYFNNLEPERSFAGQCSYITNMRKVKNCIYNEILNYSATPMSQIGVSFSGLITELKASPNLRAYCS